MSSRGIRVVPDELRQIAFGAIGAGFTAIPGITVPAVYTNPIRILILKNATNAPMYISYDGTFIHDFLPAASGQVLDFTANAGGGHTFPFIAAGTTVYVTYDVVAPTSGSVTVSAYYCVGD